LEKKLIVRDISMWFGMQMDNAPAVQSVERSALMLPFEYGGRVKKNRWGDGEIRR
jgi:hypothetical protein